MTIPDEIIAAHQEMTAWRRHLHAHPETAYEEHATAQFVAERLASFGIDVHRGLAGTGVVGTLGSGEGAMIGLRADMDALPFEEANDFPHRSRHAGKMHACGHDGHTAMLLGAAGYLARTRRFRGTVRFIFQPAEENEAGAQKMVEEGLFEQFPMQRVYGLHNWPALPAGRLAVRAGPVMAACDLFEIAIEGRGCHAAMPHHGTDAVLAASAVVVACQGIVARNVDPLQAAVISVTQVHAGDTWNVLPSRAMLRGTVRSFTPAVQDACEAALDRVASGVAAAHGCRVKLRYDRRYPATVNDPDAVRRASRAAAMVLGEQAVDLDPVPSMGSEDFAFMLARKPGAYVWLGSGSSGPSGCVLHSPFYDFNDAVLPLGAAYWAALVESELAD